MTLTLSTPALKWVPFAGTQGFASTAPTQVSAFVRLIESLSYRPATAMPQVHGLSARHVATAVRYAAWDDEPDGGDTSWFEDESEDGEDELWSDDSDSDASWDDDDDDDEEDEEDDDDDDDDDLFVRASWMLGRFD